jgi:hypothetical protein
MSEYRLGDRHLVIAGVETRLRFTVLALAEITSTLKTDTPSALALRLRRASDADWNVVVRALATPRVLDALSRTELEKILPDLSSLISEGLTV